MTTVRANVDIYGQRLGLRTEGDGARLQELARLMPVCAGVRRWGAASLDLAYVAAGRYDGFWERGLHSWDIAAGIVIVREAGGIVEPLKAAGDILSDGEMICANEPIFESFAKVIRKA